ncbi:unnamed protein product [Symbiodinium microadriaticum]|nr:unnamed protein product [Symbiodinium microadriaticum]
MTNLSNDLDFIDLELGISEPVAIEPPLQAEVDEASDDRQAVSASEVASKQPLQTEVDDASDDPQAVSASEVASEQPLQTEVDHASDDRQAMSALDVVAIEQPLQTEVGEASYDPQAVSASEVASEQPLQTEVDHASDDPQAVSSSEAASEQPRQTVDGDIDEVEDCWGSSDEEEEDEEETEERIDNSSRDELILHSSTMALRVDALEARDVHEEAARIVMARLDHLSGAQGQELDEDSAASLLDPQLVMFGAVKVIGGLMLKSICNGRGWEVTCRGGQAALSCASAYIRDQGASFILLIPLAMAKQWWKQRGFQAVEGVCRFHRHKRHGCRVAVATEESLRAQLQHDSEIVAAVVDATRGTTDPLIRWL